ncbi:MAG: IS630 family transposase, partial [Pseudomonadales bacterium]
MRTKGSATELEARRRRSAKLFRERKPLAEIVRHVGASLSSVKRWKRAWQEGGVAALAAKPHPGPTPKLSPDQKQELVAMLKAGPVAAGFKTDLWTCARVAKVVRKKFRVSYHPDHLGRILHDLGFTPQKPQRVAREQDAQAVERWRKKDWPRIKKKLAGAVPALYLSMKPGFGCSR